MVCAQVSAGHVVESIDFVPVLLISLLFFYLIIPDNNTITVLLNKNTNPHKCCKKATNEDKKCIEQKSVL